MNENSASTSFNNPSNNYRDSNIGAKCTICLLDPIPAEQDPSQLRPCGHRFCLLCILEWSKISQQCPLCKQSMESIEYHSITDPSAPSQLVSYSLADPVSRNLDSAVDFNSDRRPVSLFSPYHPQYIQAYQRYQHNRFAQRPHARPVSRRPSSYVNLDIDNNESDQSSTAASLKYAQSLEERRQLYITDKWTLMQLKPSVNQSSTSAVKWKPLPNADLFKRNPLLVERLRPWLRRELEAILHSPADDNDIVLHYIEALLMKQDLIYQQTPAPSLQEGNVLDAFIGALTGFVFEKTEHFVYELVVYIRCPFDLETYGSILDHHQSKPENYLSVFMNDV